MDIVQMVKEGSELMQQVKPGFDAAAGMIGTVFVGTRSAIEIIERGKKVFTYWVAPKEKIEKEKKEAETPDQTEEVSPPARKRTLRSKKLTDVAVVIDITRRTMVQVAEYLKESKIKAEIILVTNDPGYGPNPVFMDETNPEEWEELVREFCTSMNAVQYRLAPKNYHIFLAAPLPVAFGIGAAWGTTNEATVYHWEPSSRKYFPVIVTQRALRQGESRNQEA